MLLPDTPVHNRKSPDSGKTSRDGAAGRHAIPPGENESASDATAPQDGKKASCIGKFDWESLITGKKTSCRSEWEALAAGESPQQVGGAGRLTWLILIGYLLPLFSLAALADNGPSDVTQRMLTVLVCFGPAVILALLGMWSARRAGNAGGTAHAGILLVSLLYGVGASLLWISSGEVDPGPAGPVESAGFSQVLEFILLAPARLFSSLFHHMALFLGYWIVVRVFMAGVALLAQKSPCQLIRYSTGALMRAVWLLIFSVTILWEIR